MSQQGKAGKDAGRPAPTLYYRDYIKSNAWEVRKAQYYQRHAKACRICGDTNGVELNHIKYGNYGQEKDKDFVPLCRTHHQALHDKIGVRKDMHYQTEYFLADMIAQWDGMHEGTKSTSTTIEPIVTVVRQRVGVYETVDRIARPLWRLIDIVFMRR